MSIKQFFQGSEGEMSSKRLGWLLTLPFVTIGTVWLCDKLIDKGKADYAVDIWNSFYIYSALIGGYITLDIIKLIIYAWKGQPIPTENKDKNVQNNN